jgi:hypothetical protein
MSQNYLYYGGPAEILTLSILTNRKINVSKDFFGKMFSKPLAIKELQLCLNENTEETVSYDWNSSLVFPEPLSLFYYNEHFTTLLTKSELHFTINYHYLAPFNDALPERHQKLDELYIGCDPTCLPSLQYHLVLLSQSLTNSLNA